MRREKVEKVIKDVGKGLDEGSERLKGEKVTQSLNKSIVFE